MLGGWGVKGMKVMKGNFRKAVFVYVPVADIENF